MNTRKVWVKKMRHTKKLAKEIRRNTNKPSFEYTGPTDKWMKKLFCYLSPFPAYDVFDMIVDISDLP